ncbi:type II toxin-antitoxin system RelE/ParE family toxin [Algoriphagus kandeliae]|uniref:Type II toxin-antitoxin system RelE/ParE family toxin n=1 Tax=Algoriphagus kandeliae TaxID=2562278 RepID=A0A4Y9QM73_9BACT|nr:type II toxin-antitoxin system RelE/ParE family toxin [Algoriphagus kandeliae]TFV93297.1 type II toxin-antitoxin system RelE/ParE family toxin [Algoriphagus kandeliae]
MSYSLSFQAEEDLIQIFLYGLKTFGESQAERYFSSLEKTFERIAKNPEMYPMASEFKEGYRFCIHISHTIFFKMDEEVKIIRIIGRQKFP